MGLIGYNHLISNKHKWNNCFIKFGAFLYSLILLDFNFTKQPEVDVAKTTTSGKSHDISAVCKISWMKNLKAKQANLRNETIIK